jgi:hypothetical protein
MASGAFEAQIARKSGVVSAWVAISLPSLDTSEVNM